MDGDRALPQGEIGESEGGPPAVHPVGHEGTRVDVTEREAWSVDGFAGLAVALLLLGLGCWMTVAGIIAEALSAVFDDTSVSEIFDGENLA